MLIHGRTGFRHSEETKEKIRQANLGHTVSEETRKKLREINHDNSFFGSEKGKEMAKKRNKRLIEEGRHPSQILHLCPHCQREVSKTTLTRWHGDRCKTISRAVKET